MTETRQEAWDGPGTGKVEFITRTVYDDRDRVLLQTDSYLNTDPIVFGTRTLYDSADRAFGSVRVKGVVVAIDAAGKTTITTAGADQYQTSSFYNVSRLTRSVDALGNVTESEYDSFGRQTASIGPQVEIGSKKVRQRTETAYDSLGRTAEQRSGIIHDESGKGQHDTAQLRRTRYTYDSENRVVRTIFHDGSYTQVRYDALGRKIAESKTVASDVQIVWSPSDKSFKNQVNNQPVPTRLTEYDYDGRMIAVALPAVADPLNANTLVRPRYQYGHSLSGQQSLIVDPYGYETRFTFDALGRQTSRTLPLGFGVDGKQGTSDDASAVAFSEYDHYDSRGRKSLHISFEGVHEQNIYDDKTGRLTEIRYYPNASAFANGTSSEVRKFSFDNRGRTNKIEHFVGGVSTRIETMEFDDDGRLYETMNPEGKVRYTYDVQGRMTRKEWSSTAFMPTGVQAFENTVNYTYDELGRLKTVVQRDRGGVTLGTSDVTAYRYTLDGLLDQTRYHNGIIHDNDYDSLGRLKTLTHWRDLNADGKQQSSENLASFDYTVRADGKRTKVVESIKNETNGVITEVLSKEFTWEYDAVDRLISETLVDEPFSQPPTRVYDLDWIYDLAGNRRMQTKSLPNENGGYAPSEVTTYAYDANDRLTSESVTGDSQSTTTYSFDKTQQSGKQSTQSGITTTQTFVYDLQGLLASVTTTKTDGSNPTKTVYRYDSTGIRVESSQWTAPVGDPTAYSLQSKTLFLTDTQNHTGYSQVLQETTYEGGVATKKVIYTIGHDQISQTILLPLPNGGEGWGEGATHWFGTDGHGSVRVLYDFAATIVKDAANFNRLQVYTFDAYGNLQGWPTSSLTPNTLPLTTYLYSGESFDFNIGQQYLRARFYDATTGRFNRLDPFAGNSSDPQSFHKYAYVHGDPIQGIDPTGMFFSLVGFLGTAGLVGVGLQATHLGLTLYNELRAQSLRISATGIGGRSIDGKLEKLGADLELQWGKANASTRRRLFEAAHTSAGWEIVEFKQSQLESRMNPLGQVPRSISLKENVYLKVEVNYFLWGALNYLAHKEGLSTTTIVGTNNGSINQMSEIARRYRAITNFAYVHVENDGSIDGRVAWAKAGWRFMETKVLAEPVWTRLKRAIPDLTASPEINGYIGSPDGIANPVTLLFGSHTRS